MVASIWLLALFFKKIIYLCIYLFIQFAGDRAISVPGPQLWNGLPSSVRTVDHMDWLKSKLKSYLFLNSSKRLVHIAKGAI